MPRIDGNAVHLEDVPDFVHDHPVCSLDAVSLRDIVDIVRVQSI